MFMFNSGAMFVLAFTFGSILILSLVLAFRETLREFYNFFDPRLLRTAFRSMIRFRLSTLLLVFTVIQCVLGIVIWLNGKGEWDHDICTYLALGGFVLWIIHCAMSDSLRPTTRKRWRFLTRSPRAVGPRRVRKSGKPPIRRRLVNRLPRVRPCK